MARIRTIKPEFFTDDEIAALPPLVRLFYVGLWTQADREGRLKDKPRPLKATIMPYDENFDAEDALQMLVGGGFVVRYEAKSSGQYDYSGPVIQIRSFTRHQCPNKKEASSRISPPDESMVKAPNKHGEDTGQAQDGREGKG